jgi:hypothetical protein
MSGLTKPLRFRSYFITMLLSIRMIMIIIIIIIIIKIIIMIIVRYHIIRCH